MRTLADSECVMRNAGTIQSPREDVGPVPDKLSKISNNKKPGAMAAARAGRETGNSRPNVPGSKPHRRIRYMVPATGFGTGERETHPPVLHGNNANIRPVDTPRHRTEFCVQLMVRGLPRHQCFYGLRAHSKAQRSRRRLHEAGSNSPKIRRAKQHGGASRSPRIAPGIWPGGVCAIIPDRCSQWRSNESRDQPSRGPEPACPLAAAHRADLPRVSLGLPFAASAA
jgi:hypothetical protein